MFSFSWLKKKNNSTASSSIISQTPDMFDEIHRLLVAKAEELKQGSISRNYILIIADRWQEPPGTPRPTDNELITELSTRGLITDDGSEQYRINDPV